jgi:long-chain acyl-CoA synthetase
LAAGGQLVYTDRRRFKEDLRSVRPTVVAAVPRIWEMVYRGILSRIEGASTIKRQLLSVCLELCTRSARRETSAVESGIHRLLTKTLLAPFKQAVGGRLALAVSGGGALPQHVHEFFLALGLPLLNGYGLTETSPVVSLRSPRTNCVGTIGRPLPQTEVQIRDEHGVPLPVMETGLIWIRGPQVMKGYYKNEEATRRVIDSEGWFNSGDLGCITADGQIRITGRAKDTIVLSGGENVEPEPIENSIADSPLVQQVVLVGQDRKQVGALLVADQEALAQCLPQARWQESQGLLTGADVNALYRRELDRTVSAQNGYRPVDRIGPFRVLLAPFTIEDGSMTPTMKIKRRVVHERHAKLIDAMFGGD